MKILRKNVKEITTTTTIILNEKGVSTRRKCEKKRAVNCIKNKTKKKKYEMRILGEKRDSETSKCNCKTKT